MKRLDEDFKQDFKEEMRKSDYVGTGIGIRIVFVLIILTLIGGGVGVLYTRTVGKAQANAEREVFKATKTYNEAAATFLVDSYKDYNDADTENDKNAVMNFVVMRYPNLDLDGIDNDILRQFYIDCLDN